MYDGIVYNTNDTFEYLMDFCNYKTESSRKYYSVTCTKAKRGNETFLLHNEISFNFEIDVKTKDFKITSGWHIGTEDFTFSLEEGDDCDKYIEEYNPGLIAQLKSWVNKNI